MKILLTNDDGIHATGIWAAARSLAEIGEVVVVAPDREQSGVGASMTLHAPLFVHTVPAEQYLAQYSPGEDSPPRSADAVLVPAPDTAPTYPISAWAVQGTPADACILALEQLVNPKPDLVVSGINRGSNLGWDVIVSGTVGAATQGWVRGYPTIAISVGSVQAPRYQLAAQVVAHLARRLADAPSVSPSYFLNVNVPNEPAEKIAGVQGHPFGRPGLWRIGALRGVLWPSPLLDIAEPSGAGRWRGERHRRQQGQLHRYHADGHGVFNHQ